MCYCGNGTCNFCKTNYYLSVNETQCELTCPEGYKFIKFYMFY